MRHKAKRFRIAAASAVNGVRLRTLAAESDDQVVLAARDNHLLRVYDAATTAATTALVPAATATAND